MDYTLAVPGALAGSTSLAEPPVPRSLLAQVAHAAGELRNPLGRKPAEGLIETIRAAAAPGFWQPPGVDAALAPAPIAAAAQPIGAAPPAPSPAPAAASRPAPLATQTVPAPAPSQPSAAALWAGVAADINVGAGFNADGTPKTVGGRLCFIEPTAGRSAGPVWDQVAEKLNAELRAGATPEASTAAGGQPADLWAQTAADINAEGRAASAAFVIPGARGAHAESKR